MMVQTKIYSNLELIYWKWLNDKWHGKEKTKLMKFYVEQRNNTTTKKEYEMKYHLNLRYKNNKTNRAGIKSYISGCSTVAV